MGIKPYVILGPNLSLFLFGEFLDDNGELDKLRDRVSSLDFGINAGFGIILSDVKGSIFLESQYGLGLLGTYEDYKIRSTKIMIGILIPY